MTRIFRRSTADYRDLDAHQDFAGIKFLNPSGDLVKLCNDKLSLNRFLLQTEYRDFIPRLYEPGDAPFPYIIKRREDQWGMNSYLVRNPQEEQDHANLIGDPGFFLQTYVSGTQEYATHILAVDGRIIFGTTIISETASDFYVRGARSSPNSFCLSREPRWVDAFAGVISRIGYTGTCCIDYKITNGLPRIFEINPRFGWSLHMDINEYLHAYLNALRSRATADPFHSERCLVQPGVK